MKGAFLISIAIVAGLVLHGYITKPSASPTSLHTGKDDETTLSTAPNLEDVLIADLKKALASQVSELQARVIELNGIEYLYMLHADESTSGKGMRWEHMLFKSQGDSLVKVLIPSYFDEDIDE